MGFARFGLLMLAAVLIGCGEPKLTRPKPKVEPTEQAKPTEQAIATDAGKFTRVSEKDGRPTLWTAEWKSAKLDVSSEGSFGGELERVSGQIFRAGNAVSRYRADKAIAKRDSNVLVLSGNVEVESLRPAPSQRPENAFEGTLHCDRLEWDGDREVVRAIGNVTLNTPQYGMGPFPEIVASPDLKHIATPNLFKDEHGNKNR